MLLGYSNRWFAERYNASHAWFFHGTYRTLNDGYVHTTLQVGAIALL
jgi:hypothetical protein